ncbi:hypothetical protein OHB39_34775 [Streptomyces sp. NBC_00047]|uniref:hypothetical protein n=1 Tax=Streptomyces sp. NBC_00047 TaxID=2975627 RepID=UPI00224E29F2|nr:hypothetical protein [Streptomyces sp. NBC_00047]MCX5612678.1 hypothetical protein [Streptomyces sp. NBC_00047]
MATIKTHAITRRDRSLTMLKWTLRATAILAIAAAIATPVAVSAPEAVIATPAVTASASAPDAPRAELTSAVQGKTRSDFHVAF